MNLAEVVDVRVKEASYVIEHYLMIGTYEIDAYSDRFVVWLCRSEMCIVIAETKSLEEAEQIMHNVHSRILVGKYNPTF